LAIESTPGSGSRLVISAPTARSKAGLPPIEVEEAQPRFGSKHIAVPLQERKIRVMLADDHVVVRQGIANLLSDEPDIEIVGTAADGQEAVDLAPKLLPDVILMDMSMPKLNGIDATRIIHNELPEIHIIGLSMFEEAEKAQEMRDAGARSYITKSGPAEELIKAIRAAAIRPQESAAQ